MLITTKPREIYTQPLNIKKENAILFWRIRKSTKKFMPEAIYSICIFKNKNMEKANEILQKTTRKARDQQDATSVLDLLGAAVTIDLRQNKLNDAIVKLDESIHICQENKLIKKSKELQSFNEYLKRLLNTSDLGINTQLDQPEMAAMKDQLRSLYTNLKRFSGPPCHSDVSILVESVETRSIRGKVLHLEAKKKYILQSFLANKENKILGETTLSKTQKFF